MALAITVFTSGDALAGKGGNGGSRNTATITFATSPAPLSESTDAAWPGMGDTVEFVVTANVKERDLNNLWVANRCSQNGVPVSQEYHGVLDGFSGPFTLNWPDGGAAECTAHVWVFPDPETPVSGGSMTYSAAP